MKEEKNYYEEVFTSQELDSFGAAESKLEAVRAEHSEEAGWVELETRITELPNGKFIMERKHRKYYN